MVSQGSLLISSISHGGTRVNKVMTIAGRKVQCTLDLRKGANQSQMAEPSPHRLGGHWRRDSAARVSQVCAVDRAAWGRPPGVIPWPGAWIV